MQGWLKIRMVRDMLPLAGSSILIACTATISSPGKSNDALQADMSYCHAGSLSLHNQSVINCLGGLGDTIKYADGSIPSVTGRDNRANVIAADGKIPPHTSRNPYDIPLSEAELRKREAIATDLMGKIRTDMQSGARSASGAEQSNGQAPATTTDASISPRLPMQSVPAATAPTPVAETPVAGAKYGLGDLRAIVGAYNENRPKFARLYAGQSFGFDGFVFGKQTMNDISLGYVVTFNVTRDPNAFLAPLLSGGVIACIEINDEATIDRVNEWVAATPTPRVRVLGTISDAEAVGLRLTDCTMKGP